MQLQSDHRKDEQALVSDNARLRRGGQRPGNGPEALLDALPVGVAVFDGSRSAPLSCNREAARIIEMLGEPGCPPEEFLHLVDVRRADGRELTLEGTAIARALGAGETVRTEETVLSRDGRSVTVLLSAAPVPSGEGAAGTFAVTLQDMTPLADCERLRAGFLAMVSHELRTPLAAVKGSTKTLLDPSAALSPVESREFLRIIDAQTDHMRLLISDFLDLAHIRTGVFSVSPEPADLRTVANGAASAFRAAGNTHPLLVDVPPELPWVMADRARIAQVLGNLLSNAARRSPESSAIRLSAVRGDFHVSVSVSDEGVDIPAESLPDLFQNPSGGAGRGTRRDAGLGLEVCRGIVESHGGRIWAESGGPGLGARFTFTVPTVDEGACDPGLADVEATGHSAPRDRAGRRKRILAVDDDPQALRHVRDVVTRAGYTVIATGDPDDALHLVEQSQPHLVLLNTVLQGKDSIDLIRDVMGPDGTPVMFVSAHGQDDLVARAFEAGAADYIVKPFSPTELVARVRAALRRWETPAPSRPYVFGDLRVDYAGRAVTLAGEPLRLTALEYRTLGELSANAGRLLTYAQLLERVWGTEDGADLRPMRTVISSLRRLLRDDADNPTYIFTEPRIGYRMPRGMLSNRLEVTVPGPDGQ